MRLCVWWTKQRVKAARLGNAIAMMHDLRIVNARGHQEWNGHDRYDKAHPTLPVWRDSRPNHNTTRVHAYSLRSSKKAACGRQNTVLLAPGEGRELERHGAKTGGVAFASINRNILPI
jgi:hypothetical protein